MYYVYVLYSLKDNSLYVGKTNDILDRLNRHTRGLVTSTKFRRPLELVHLEVYKTSSEIYNRELELKMPCAGRFKNELRARLGLVSKKIL